MDRRQKIRNAICIGTLCSISYLAVYFARNILGAVTPQMIEGGYAEKYIGRASSFYFVFYAIGQLINGIIGDRVKTKYMIPLGLLFAGTTNLLFSHMSLTHPGAALFIYGLTGFSLSMIYGPMTKVVAENTEPVYATRCSLGYTFASFFGSPLAGVAATLFIWQKVFSVSTAVLYIMSVVCFAFFVAFEKKGIIKYNQYKKEAAKGGSIKVLLKNRIVKFTIIAILTGIVRTTVVFWMPTYFSQYLGFSAKTSTTIFTVATLIISFTTFITIFIYEKLRKNMDLTILLMFSVSAFFFGLLYIVKSPFVNIAFIIIAIMASNGAATMLWSRYCPSLRDTGMVSGVTGFLDFTSYIAAAISSSLFANAVTQIGWKNLILVWFVIVLAGAVVSLPYKKREDKMI